jgi:hypothetical protein
MMALYRQSAELDTDIASVLTQQACEPWAARSPVSNPSLRRAPGGIGSRRCTHEYAGRTPCTQRLQKIQTTNDRPYRRRLAEIGYASLAPEWALA